MEAIFIFSFIAVTACLTCQAIMLNEETKDADFNGLMVDDERGRNFRKSMYSNKRLQDIIIKWLPEFDRSGLLDLVEQN